MTRFDLWHPMKSVMPTRSDSRMQSIPLGVYLLGVAQSNCLCRSCNFEVIIIDSSLQAR